MVATGSSPIVSGRSRTRLRNRPCRNGRARLVAGWCSASGNIAPPGRSRLPVSTFSTSTAHAESVPNSTVWVPMRPYTQAGAAGEVPRHSRVGRVESREGDAVSSGAKACTASTHLFEAVHRDDVPGDEILVEAPHEREQPASGRLPAGWGCEGRPARRSSCAADRRPRARPPRATQRLQPPRPIRCRRQAAVRFERIRAEHQQEVGAVDVGDRNRGRVAEHVPARHVLGHLVDGDAV
jgi:hypothetical protein